MRPFTFRPPLFLSGSVRLFSGSVFVISSNDETDMKRRPGLVGLYLRIAIRLGAFEDLDRLAGLDLDDRLLPAGLPPLDKTAPLRLGAHLDHVHALDVDVEQFLDGLADLRLVRVRVDAKRVAMVGLDLLVALLGDHGGQKNLVRMKTHEALPCTSSSAPSLTSSERAQTSAEISTSDGVTTWTPWRL